MAAACRDRVRGQSRRPSSRSAVRTTAGCGRRRPSADQAADHSMIFVVIAGTATPARPLVAPQALVPGPDARRMGAGAGVRHRDEDAPHRSFQVLTGHLYIALGWAVAPAVAAARARTERAARCLVIISVGSCTRGSIVLLRVPTPTRRQPCSAITRSGIRWSSPPAHAITWPFSSSLLIRGWRSGEHRDRVRP